MTAIKPSGKFANPAKVDFEVPSWAGKAPTGTHLNVMKGEKLVEKLIIDEKKCYVFGRNSDSCDFITEHSSCSRVHAVLVYHKHLKRMFIIDLGSTHGSMIGRIRLEGRKPTPVPFDSTIHFGASTRHYVLKERPPAVVAKEEAKMEEELKFGLPFEEDELDNLTEYNTAHNKRVTTLPVDEPVKLKRKRKSISFNDEEIIINPEDVDPNVGRFRNMVSVQVIPSKKFRGEGSGLIPNTSEINKRVQEFYNQGLYESLDSDEKSAVKPATVTSPSASSGMAGFSLPLPNPAPDIEMEPEVKIQTALKVAPAVRMRAEQDETRPRKKYIKEAWPGRKPTPALLV
ncbi:nuclear inhibitor of protein phosphatase 1-like [Styela clava]|uniref:nuclear inhibitor of protein phosphatase 1-like n=1 Tax=Styela clava TaxID=7725 RepID=UPI001939BD11|nr:nuclear inhibitor of protein phosphatase 1-like [Styela clava]XP_039271901.1 nuclear inhibitor of protein phosphatase 1-like [Styela clava]